MDQRPAPTGATAIASTTGGSMRIRWTAPLLVAAALASAPGPAQAQAHNETGMTTETQERKAAGDSDLLWNILGCFGLIGLLGLQRPHDNDGYTDDPI
jgi:hypothetical protein